MRAAAAASCWDGGGGAGADFGCFHRQSTLSSHHTISFTNQCCSSPSLGFTLFTGAKVGLYEVSYRHSIHRVVDSSKAIKALSSSSTTSAWDHDSDYDSPYEVLPDGKRVYLDEQDIVTFLDPPNELIPLDPSSYNPAAYLWKKIEDVPEERRHRLLHLLQPRLISRAWGIAGTRYEDPKLSKKTASALLSEGDTSSPPSLEFWNCRTSGGPMPLSRIKFFRKAIFRCKDDMTCGRLLFESFVGRLATSFSPLYFTVTRVKEVMSTEHPCDFAYHFGDGISDIHEYPSGFPKPAKHPWPFNDQVVIYVLHLGPGVLVGQAWQEGEELEKLPQKLCGEILMVKDYATSSDN